MKTPPLLLFVTLLFWGWQSNVLLYGAVAGAILEGARLIPLRWELEDVDFNRIWSFCVVAIIAFGGYLFTTNDDVAGGVSGMFHGAAAVRNAAASSTVATFTVLRWLPVLSFPFIVAQCYNARPTVPITAVSLVLRLRRRRGEQSLAGRYVDLSYAYFILCLFSAGIHSNQATYSYFAGQVVLILWVLWTLRSRRFGPRVWSAGLGVAVGLGFLGQVGISQLERLVQDFDVQMFARFFHSHTDPTQSVTSLGQLGELKLSRRIVIRLQPGQVGVVPPYLREASYRHYNADSRTWSVGGQNDFVLVEAETNSDTWTLRPPKSPENFLNIACYLEGRSPERDPEGVLPLPPGTCRLEHLPAATSILQTNKTGVVLAIGTGLMIFDAAYGPGATFDSPPDAGTNRFDLSVPTNEIPALNRVLAEINLTNATAAEARLAVQAFFARNFTYSRWQGLDRRPTADATPLTRFLLTSRSGHCEYFATATVLLLRQLGIPARYAVGYAVHETSGSGYVVRERDAHAWCLAWNRQSKTWEDFDTTPGSWVAIESGNTSFLDFFSDLRSWLGFQIEKLRWHQTNLRQYIPWTVVPVLLVLLYYIFFQRPARRRAAATKPAAAVVWPGQDSAFYRLEKSLAARGLPRQAQEPLSDWLERVLAEPALAAFRPPLQQLLQLHYRYRFDPLGLNDTEKNSLIQNADALHGALARLNSGG
jgi:hypothetical protein